MLHEDKDCEYFYHQEINKWHNKTVLLCKDEKVFQYYRKPVWQLVHACSFSQINVWMK